jgi:hypothetical protein
MGAHSHHTSHRDVASTPFLFSTPFLLSLLGFVKLITKHTHHNNNQSLGRFWPCVVIVDIFQQEQEGREQGSKLLDKQVTVFLG